MPEPIRFKPGLFYKDHPLFFVISLKNTPGYVTYNQIKKTFFYLPNSTGTVSLTRSAIIEYTRSYIQVYNLLSF